MSRKDWTNDKLFTRLLNNKSSKTYWENIAVLRSRPTKDVFDKCVELLNSDKPKERIIGIDILAQLGTTPRVFLKETIELFFGLLDRESDSKALFSLLFAIGHNNENLKQVQIERLIALKDEQNSTVRQALVNSLLGVDNEKAVETLIFLSNDKVNSIRNWATFGIGSQTERNTKTIREALWKRVNDKDQDTKLEAIAGLATRKENQVKEVIKQELISGEFGNLLYESIIELGETDFLPTLRQQQELANKDSGIKPEWKTDLQNCINKLEEIEKKKTTA